MLILNVFLEVIVMKFRKVLIVGFCLCMVMATPAVADLAATAHNFNASWSDNEICKPCHTPHGNPDTSIAPLWQSRTLSAGTYKTYRSSTTDYTDPCDANPNVLTGISKLCLSCHDGSLAIDSIKSGSTMIESINADARVTDAADDTDLTDMHPVGVTYNTTLTSADGDLALPGDVDSEGLLENYVDAATGGIVTCMSCHNAHDEDDYGKLLRDNAQSQVCTTCHLK
jgi:predicted CXXCH cytochrome family protein